MTRDGHPPRIDPRARLTIIILVIVFVIGLVAALALIDQQRTKTGGEECPVQVDPSCGRQTGDP
jgi:hypothetical protein